MMKFYQIKNEDITEYDKVKKLLKSIEG
jgi:hypothetical protein